MKKILISVRPKWCEKIASGKKTIEVRKTAPKEVPFKCYIYATKATKWFHSGIIVTSNELLWLSNGKIKMGDGFGLWANGEDYQCVNGKVIGEFVCDKILEIEVFKNGAIENFWFYNLDKSCLSFDEMGAYIGKGNIGYGWHISDLKIYDKPKELSEFNRPCSYAGLCFSCDRAKFTSKGDRICQTMITRPPQSWQFVEELKE